MIHLLGSLWSSITEQQETKILFLGDSNSGKTALFERFKIMLHELPPPPPVPPAAEQTREKPATSLAEGLASLKAEIENRNKIAEEIKLELENQKKSHQHTVVSALTSPTTPFDANSNAMVEAAAAAAAAAATNNNTSITSVASLSLSSAAPSFTKLPKFTTPTVGLNVGRGACTISVSGQKINALLWDVGGDEGLRQLWDTYTIQCHGVVFAVDLSADAATQRRNVDLLHALMKRKDLAFAPFLIVGTKYDKVVFVDVEKEADNKKKKDVDQQENGDKKEGEEAVLLTPKTILQKSMAKFMRLLRFDELLMSTLSSPSSSSPSKNSAPQQRPAASTTTSDHSNKNDNDDGGAGKTKPEQFVNVDYRQVCAADAADAVNVAPSGSVSGVVGHMYHTALVSAERPTEGSDLRQAMQWILSVAGASKARAANMPQEE